MIIQWDEGLSVHNPVLDGQHKEFIRLINNIDEAASGRGDVHSDVISAITFLEEYAQKHFSYEESYFISHNFPEADTHIELHRAYTRTLTDMRKELVLKGANVELAKNISDFAANWLISHIRTIDHRYEIFIETGQLPTAHHTSHFK